ncbi:GNAT family N-acetyltransferase [Promicromonospora iranensis]|uniref:Acetyltransferase n=1 Tax=Promicromonospora iranensis TaxID=1105144 RepID=A0ABU2CU93_9MICO|nr:GNAT family N-acetyltransferase [Promicromonospora iranensis]MDR7384911.1 putative acetyltransferase [Promicromonospora iranensis]
MTESPASAPARLIVRPTTPADRPVLERLWLLFRHDLSEVTGALPDPTGQFRRDRLDATFTDPGRRGVLAHLEPEGTPPSPVGFALVRGLDGPTHVVSSFFVVRGARRSGVGRELAAHVLASFPGRWEVPFQDANPPAVRFWRAVATDAVGQAWTEEHRAVPGRPDLPPDTWISLTAG